MSQPAFPFDPDLDSQVILTVETALDLTLVNICTKSGNSPSSSSKDCGLEEPPAFLKLRKVVSNGAATPADFTLRWDGPSTNDGSVAGDNTEFVPVPPGAYSLSETGPSIYSLASLVCVDGSNANVPVNAEVVTLAGNAEVTCTFTNALIPNPALNVVKSVTSSGPYDSVGDVITYSITVTNTGNQTLTGVTVTDPGVGAVLGACTPAIPATLAPGAQVVCAATHVVTQADINAGSYTNVAIGDSNETPPDSDDETVPVVQSKSLSLVKSASPSSYDSVGDVVAYSYLVTNTGNVRLAGPVTVADDKASVTCPAVSTVGNNDGFLDPGESITCAASYSIAQADLNAGSVTNVAKASAGGIDSNQDTETVTRCRQRRCRW